MRTSNMKITLVLTTLIALATQGIGADAIAQTETAAAFYERYQNNISAIPLPDCATETSDLSREEMQAILLEHNRARRDADRYVPRNLPPLPAVRWDCAAAQVAQTWTNQSQGVRGHSSNDWRQQQFSALTGLAGRAAALGENLSWAVGSAPQVVDPVLSSVTRWDDERADYNHANGDCNGVCGHYTQIVWRESTAIGCGIKRDRIQLPGSGKTWPYGYFLACTYHHAGNINGDNPLLQHPDWYYQ